MAEETHAFSACAISANTDNNSLAIENHPAYILGWLENGIAYSGNGISHTCYFSILFILAAFSRAIFKRTSMLHGGKLTSTSHILVMIVVGMVLSISVELWRTISSPDCLRGVWMITDVVYGSISGNTGGTHADCDVSYLYFGLLPLLLFKPSFDVETSFILRNIDTIIILGASTLITLILGMTAFIVTSIQPFTEISKDSTGFPAFGEFRSMAFAGMLATLLCTMDSSHILSLLGEIGSGKNRIAALIENGNWFATTLSLIIFELCRVSVQASETWHHTQWITTISWKLIFSPLYGFVVSKISGHFLNMIINDVLAEILLIISTVYFTFATAGLMGLSAPYALLAYNVFIEHSTISKEGETAIKKFCQSTAFFIAVYLAGTAGFVWLEELWDEVNFIRQDPNDIFDINYLLKDFVWIVILYVAVIFGRILFLLILSKILRNDAIKWKETILMGWGEIPGPITIVMALIALLDKSLNWVPGCSVEGDGRTWSAANPFDLHTSVESRLIGSCDGDVEIKGMSYLMMNGSHTATLSQLYGVGQQKIFFYGVGVLILAQIINGLTLSNFFTRLGIFTISKGQKSTMVSALTRVRQDVVNACSTMRYDAFLADADWDHVITKAHISYPYRSIARRSSSLRKSSALKEFTMDDAAQTESDLGMHYSDVDKHFEEARQRALNALKTSFSKQRNKGLLSDEAVTVLRQAVDSVQNDPTSCQFVSINQLKRNWKLFGLVPRLKNMIETHLYGNQERQIRNPWRRRWVRKCHHAALSSWFEITMQIVIMLNMALMVIENVLIRKQIIITAASLDQLDDVSKFDTYNNICDTSFCGREILELISHLFLAIYIFEVLFKGLSLTWKEYFKSRWNQFDFFIVIVSIGETIASAVIEKMITEQAGTGDSNKGQTAVQAMKSIKFVKLIKSLRAVRALRIARLLRFSKTIIPMILNSLNQRIAARIRFGYDVGRGYINGVEELDSALDMIAGDSTRTKFKLRKMSEKSKSQVVRDLGLLQRSYPGIATAVKTKTAIRNLINVMLDSVRRMQEGGILDDFEVRVLLDQINILVKSLAQIPLSMPTPDPENLFLNIPWVNGDKKLATFLRDNSNICDWDLNDFIIQDDEEPDAVYLIITGMVRIVRGQYREENESSETSLQIREEDDEDGEQICDYASTGIVVGEMGCLVGENAQLSVICETAVQTYQIPIEVIREAYSKFPKLLDTLWSVVGMQVAHPLLMKDNKFQGFSSDEIRRHLQSSYVSSFDAGQEFLITSDISEVILLDGNVNFYNEYVNAPALLQMIPDFDFDPVIIVQDRAVLLVVKRSRKEPRGKKGGRGAPKERMTFTGRQNESLARNSSVHIIRQNESRTAMSAPNFSRGNAVKPPPPLAGEKIIEEESEAAEAEPMMQ